MATHDVIVVGAGLAGLTAARRLAEQHFEVALIEARERTGGRVYTQAHPSGIALDMGGQWISPGQPLMQSLAREAGVARTRTHTTGASLYRLNGQFCSGERWPPLGPLSLLDALQIRRALDRSARAVRLEQPWAGDTATLWDAETAEAWLQRVGWTGGAQAFWRVIIEAGVCASTSEVSALALFTQLRTIGGTGLLETAEEEFFIGGAGQIADWLARQIPGSIHLNHSVQRIEQDATGVRVYAQSASWSAAAVIVAMPPALAGRMSYDPPLPSLRDGLTQRLGQGSVIKCVCVYDEPFWRAQGLSGALLDVNGPVTATLDSTADEAGPGLLVALATGRHARALSAVSPEDRRRAVLAALGEAFGVRARHPVHYVDHDWTGDVWSRGGYGALPAPGVLSQFGSAFTQPVGCLFWAGTETATSWRNYMEGAVASGEQAAHDVAGFLKGVYAG